MRIGLKQRIIFTLVQNLVDEVKFMKFMELLKKLENYKCNYDLQDVEITSNKIHDVCCLIFKYHGAVFDVIVLEDTRYADKSKEVGCNGGSGDY